MELEFDKTLEEEKGSPRREGDEFEAVVELDESMLSFPATGVEGFSGNSANLYNRMGPKKTFSLLKYKK